MYAFQRDYKIDLHSHSNYSDGELSPDELVRFAVESGLKVLAITDHNCVNTNLCQLQKKYADIISLPPACEFSCGYTTITGRVIQIHINGIAFGLDDKEILRIVEYNNKAMKPYVESILKKLKSECGINLCTYDELVSRSTAKSIGRKHIAVEMVRQGLVKDIDEAFDRFLGEGKPGYVSNATNYASLSEIVKAIVGSNGIAVINHLFKYNLSFAEIDALLNEFKTLAGKQGALEVYYSAYNEEQQFFLKKLADSYGGLLYSCGSDYHGEKGSKIKRLGQFPYEIYDRMIRTVLDLPIM